MCIYIHIYHNCSICRKCNMLKCLSIYIYIYRYTYIYIYIYIYIYRNMEVWGVQVSGLGRGVGDGIWEKLRKRDENLAERSNSA